MNKDKIKEALKVGLRVINSEEILSYNKERELLTEALRELEVADSPDMDGPYTFAYNLNLGWHVAFPGAATPFAMCDNEHDAELQCRRANTAFKAGRSSLTGIDIEQEARKWGIKEGLVHTEEERAEIERRGDPGWDLEETIIQWVSAFARFILSIKDGKGGDDASAPLPIANAWITVDDVKRAKGWSLGASLPEGTVLAYRRKAKPHHNWHYGVYVVNDDKARDQFRPHEVQLLEWPSPPSQAPTP